MALQTKTITGSTNNSNWTWKMEVIENSTDINSNTSSVTINTYLGRASSSSYFGGNATVSINCNGEARSYSKTFSYPTNVGAGGWVLAQSETFSVKHNDNGTKDINVSSSMSTSDFTPSYSSASGSITLTTIPRYFSSTPTLTLVSKTETTATFKWTTSENASRTQYKINNGGWVDVETGINKKSGSFTITGLNPNTTYTIYGDFMRYDSDLWSETKPSVSVTTYNYPYATRMPDFTIGDILSLGIYNPLGRKINIYFICSDGTELGGDEISGTSITGYYGSHFTTAMYSSIPSTKSGTYKVKVVYGSSSITKTGGTYTVNSNNCIPTIGSFTYKDNNSSTTAITGDNQRIIRNNSNLLFSVGTATAKNRASISKYEVTFNGITKSRTSTGNVDFGTVNIANNLSATLKVTDSRGFTSTKSITVVVDNWELPNALISLNRRNNYYSETYLKVDGSCSYINGKNYMDIQYQYKKVSDSSYSELTSINDNEQVTLDFDNEYQWNIRVKVADKLGETFYNLVLDRGMPIAYFDRLNSAMGVNAIPKSGEALKVAKGDVSFDGTITTGDVKCKNLFNKSNFKIDVQSKLGFDISNLEIGKTYTLSSNLPIKSFKISDYSSGYNSVAKDEENGFTIFTFTMSKHNNIAVGTKQYLFLAITDVWSWVTNISELDGYEIQIEEGTSATEYTPYKKFNCDDLIKIRAVKLSFNTAGHEIGDFIETITSSEVPNIDGMKAIGVIPETVSYADVNFLTAIQFRNGKVAGELHLGYRNNVSEVINAWAYIIYVNKNYVDTNELT